MASPQAPVLLTSPQTSLLLYLLLVFPLLLLLLHQYCSRSGGRKQASKHRTCSHLDDLPPSPPGLPLIGHLHLVGSSPHVSLARLAAKHGSPNGLLLLRLGQVRNLVVSTPRTAEAVLRTHDHLFASRPPNALADALLNGGADVAFAPYGEYWRQARRLVTTHLLSANKVRSLSLRRGREEQTRLVIDKIRSSAAAAASVDMTALLGAYTNDVVCRAVSGNGSFRVGRRNEMFREVIDGNAAALGGFNVQDYFPSLGKLDLLAWVVFAKTNRLRRRWDQLLDKIIDDHETKSSLLQQQQHGLDAAEEDQERDFVDVLLGLHQEYSLTRQHIKAILMDMFVAGTDTSYIVLEFAMAELMRKPHLMAKLQSEVRDKTPPKNHQHQMVTEDDLGAMAYLQAVVKETLRLHPPVPLLLPHLSMAECVVDGYTIPADTRVIVNAWALGRDADSWEDAGEFVPERFMADGAGAPDFKGRDFQFLPFGAGRRICPGINFGMATVEIMLANLVYNFDWELPGGMRPEDVDMSDVFGMTMRRKEKLFLVPVSPHVNRAYVHAPSVHR